MHLWARYATLTIVGVLLVALATSGAGRGSSHDAALASAASTERPNIVFVLVDDMRADDLAHMPITREVIGDAGMTFTDAVSPHPLCCPARAELVTGQYAQNNGVQHNSGDFGGFSALDPTREISQWFADEGYSTGLVGKFLNGFGETSTPPPGWTHWDALTKGIYNYEHFTFAGNGVPESFTDSYVTDAISERSNDTIRDFSATGDPFVLFSWHVAPHYRLVDGTPAPPLVAEQDRGAFDDELAPSLADPSFNESDVEDQPLPLRNRAKVTADEVNEEHRGRIGALQAVDRAVGSLVETLTETGELDNTYVVFASDNGYSLGEHRMVGKNVLTEQALKVPLLARGPLVAEGRTSDVPATLVDLPATFAAWTGVEPGWTLDGISLAPTLAGSGQLFRDTTLVQVGADDEDGWGVRGVRTERYLYGRDGSNGLLYDLALDPYALVNQFDSPRHAEVRAWLDQRRKDLVECTGTDCNQIFGAPPEPTEAPSKSRSQRAEKRR